MADASTVHLSEPHTPKPASLEAFEAVLPELKNEFHKSRAKWDQHEPEMFARVQGYTDHELLEGIDLENDLVQVRTGESAYGPPPGKWLMGLDTDYIYLERLGSRMLMMPIFM